MSSRKMMAMTSWPSASTKAGQILTSVRRERRAMAIGSGRPIGLFGERGDRAGEQADLAAHLLDRLRPSLRKVLRKAPEIHLDVAHVAAQRIVLTACHGAVGQPGQYRLQLHLVLGEAKQEVLLGLHLIAEQGQPLGERDDAGIGGDAALLAAAGDAL